MHRHRTRIATPVVGSLSLLLALLLAGCGATSTQSPLASTSGATSASAADAPRGPQLGYLWDGTQKNLFPVLGVAGAARYGAPLLAAGAQYVAGGVGGAGGATWALLLDPNGTLDALTLPAITPSIVATRVPLDAAIAFAPAGAYAVVVSRLASAAMLVSGLPGQPQVAELMLPAGATLAGAVVSDRGTVLAGWAAASGVQVGTLSPAGASAVGTVGAWGGAAFVPGAAAAGQEQAVIADAANGQMTRLSGIGSAAPASALLSTTGKLQTPLAVAVTGDSSWAFAADSAKQQLVRVDLKGSTPALAIACACQPARLLSLPGGMVFEVSTDQPAQPAWLLDAHAALPRTFFVPALAPPSTPVQAARRTNGTPARGAQ